MEAEATDYAWVTAHRLDRMGSVVIGQILPYDDEQGERVRDANGRVWPVVGTSVRVMPTGNLIEEP